MLDKSIIKKLKEFAIKQAQIKKEIKKLEEN